MREANWRASLHWVGLMVIVGAVTLPCDAGETTGFREIRDMAQRTVRIPREPARVLSLCTSATDTMLAIGETNRLAAIDEYSRIVPGTTGITVIAKGSAISREEVIARRIDLAFVWWYQSDAIRMLEDLNVPVVQMRSGRATEVPAMIRLVGESLNRREAADRLAVEIEKYLQDRQSVLSPAPRIYLELYGPFKTSGSGTYVNDLIQLAGGSNIAAEAMGSVLLSRERLIQANPDRILFVGDQNDTTAIERRDGLGALDAVKAGRIYPIDRYWLVAGANLPQSVGKLRAIFQATREP